MRKTKAQTEAVAQRTYAMGTQSATRSDGVADTTAPLHPCVTRAST
jgi:hypothetical protein